MFNGYGEAVTKDSIPCKRDYEGEARRLRIKINAMAEIHKSLSSLMTSSLRYEVFDSKDEQLPFLALIGGLSISIPRLENEYESLLKSMESEK